MRLSEYPYVKVRIACSKCSRKDCYRLARLADRYGAETALPAVLYQLAADCKQRDQCFRFSNFCGAFFPDIGTHPPDKTTDAGPRLRVVRSPG